MTAGSCKRKPGPVEAPAPGHSRQAARVAEKTPEKIGAYEFRQAGQRLTQDSVLLADFVLPLKKEDIVLDLGAGSGVMPLIFCLKSEAGKIVGVEINEKAAKSARENISVNCLAERVEIMNRDWRTLKGIFPGGSFSVIVSNPPYVKKGSGRISPSSERALARHESAGTLRDLIEISEYLLSKKGRLFYVYPVRRLQELFSELKRFGMKPVRISFVHAEKGLDADVFLIEAGFGGELRVEGSVFRK
ncbi:MAG: methyltransferase [Deltaproteobacteria bacterium]